MSSSLSIQKQRHRARRLAMQALFQWHFSHTEIQELIFSVLESQKKIRFDRNYFVTLVKGYLEDSQAVDEAIRPALDRPLTELNPVELSILRIAVYELQNQIELSYKVVINEAIEIAKDFGSNQGYKYVNAILDRLVHKIPHNK